MLEPQSACFFREPEKASTPGGKRCCLPRRPQLPLATPTTHTHRSNPRNPRHLAERLLPKSKTDSSPPNVRASVTSNSSSATAHQQPCLARRVRVLYSYCRELPTQTSRTRTTNEVPESRVWRCRQSGTAHARGTNAAEFRGNRTSLDCVHVAALASQSGPFFSLGHRLIDLHRKPMLPSGSQPLAYGTDCRARRCLDPEQDKAQPNLCSLHRSRTARQRPVLAQPF